jgi:pimeloyl-[acyl-carrier protein] methyl ester esterase
MVKMRDSVTCIFVHGWAMNSAVWDDCIAQLPDWIDAIVVDLPGHGTMAGIHPGAQFSTLQTSSSQKTLDEYVQALVPLVHRPVIWVGWSLGGLVVLRLAELYPQRVSSALLVATNPCFVARQDWSCAVEAKVFDQFASDLKQQQEKTIRRFLALQVRGLPDAMKVVRQLQIGIRSRGMASSRALVSGLKVLLETDLRQNIKLIERPLHWFLGDTDSLVPCELAQVLQKDYAQDDVKIGEKAGHAPFISHRDDFIKQLLAMAETLRGG